METDIRANLQHDVDTVAFFHEKWNNIHKQLFLISS